jgi:hypothetical protein
MTPSNHIVNRIEDVAEAAIVVWAREPIAPGGDVVESSLRMVENALSRERPTHSRSRATLKIRAAA